VNLPKRNAFECVKNIAALLVSIGLLAIVLEGIVFRFILPPSDLPLLQEMETRESVLKYMPDQQGIYRKQNDIAAEYQINSNGWNSGYSEYSVKKGKNERRICIIGDSYIEALQVRYDRSVAEILERNLSSGEERSTVFRFGLSGAPLSQYIFMLEHEVLDFHPDVVIINLVHNDFDESVRTTGGSYDRGFAKFRYAEDHTMTLESPKIYKRDAIWWIKRSASFRYWRVRREVDLARARKALIELLNPEQIDSKNEVSANTVIRRDTLAIVEDVTRYAFAYIKQLSHDYQFRPIVIIDGDRSEIMSSVDSNLPSRAKTRKVNELVVKIANELSLEVVDLWPIFENEYQMKKKRLTFESDGHWPPYVHELVANTLASAISEK
jgi:hypothetical protein